MHKLTIDVEKCDGETIVISYPVKSIELLDKIVQVLAEDLGVKIELPKTKKGGG